jgi:molybdate transport system ATP-binding protein
MSLSASFGHRIGSLDLDVSLDVAPGGVLALLGPNGAGKSTVLRAIAGLTPIDSGTISIDGVAMDHPVSGTFVASEHRSVGVMFQQYLLFDHLTAVENVAFGLRARGTNRHQARRTAHEWLDRVGLGDVASARPRELSGGQAQRVALARALAPNPRVVLLDEPLAALDASVRAATRRDLHQHLASVDAMRVIVTHDPIDAYVLAKQVAVIENGRIVQAGTLTEIAAHPRSRYVGDLVGVNLVTGDVHDGALHTASGAVVVVADALSGPSFAVIRPHSISLTREVPVGTSSRNVFTAIVADLDRLGDRVRVTLDGSIPLTAEITAAALDALELRPGDRVHAAVKATDIDVYPA